MDKDLHIITLNIPCPPDYGGMIDSYFRIRALRDAGVRIHLHCYEYGRAHSDDLEKICVSVKYYPRMTGLLSIFSICPYIVKSRRSGKLLKDLLDDNFPIFFDGLQSTYYLGHRVLKDREKFVRLHNIEHQYYYDLARAENNTGRKVFYTIEAIKLKFYEKILKKAEKIFPISWTDNEHFMTRYANSLMIPPFHPYDHILGEQGMGGYLLYHGDLSVNQNEAVATYLADEVFSRIPYTCIIAGKNPSENLSLKLSGYQNIQLIRDPDNDRMSVLIRNAHIIILPALASNGFRIKLLVSLYSGRYCLVNKQMISGTGLEKLCEVASSAKEFIDRISFLMTRAFTETMIKEREATLIKQFDNASNAEKMAGIIFKEETL